MKFRIATVAATAAAIAIPALALYAFTAPAAAGVTETAAAADRAAAGRRSGLVAGYDGGLYRLEASGSASPLWVDGEVRKILRNREGWFLLTSRGLVYSADLALFENRSKGLPIKTYKRYTDGKKSFLTEVMDLKDLEADPEDPATLVTCTKDAVYLSRDAGRSWENLGSPSPTSGLKAVAVGVPPQASAAKAVPTATGQASAAGSAQAAPEKYVWASHPIKGLFARRLGKGQAWAPVNDGLVAIEGSTNYEEVADAALAVRGIAGGAAPAGGREAELWAGSSFLPRLYRWDSATRSFAAAWAGSSDFGCVESLDPVAPGEVRFVAEGSVMRYRVGAEPERDGPAMEAVSAAAAALPGSQLCCVAWEEGGRAASLSELWLVSFVDRKPRRALAENRNGLYLATGFVVHEASRQKYDRFMDDRRLDAVVVDVKDDFGRLRFDPKDPVIRRVGKVTSPLDVESFAAAWKAKGRYLVARIPVFKDQVAYYYAGGKWATWGQAAGAPWRGYYLPKAAGGEVQYIDEYWVDPYCEEAWAYNVAIANEMLGRGFDEVQFDYIRFPTDGDNLDQAGFRWRDPGMDKESAIASFLRYARENIDAPISVDIYGANGWFRSGARTGQDVELMAKYVDVICPMLYPSHFEQDFLAQPPAELRPYRIYRLGTLRTTQIARKKVAVRPYVQAFYLNVSYDKTYYDLAYVRREVEGVRDATNLGLTFWNNAGRYDDVPVLDLAPDGKLAARDAVPAGKALLD